MAFLAILVIVFVAVVASWFKFANRDFGILLTQLLYQSREDAFRDKVVWITGASQGLGRLLVQHFSNRGAKLIISARTIEKLEEVAKEFGGEGRIHVLPFDLKSAQWDAIAAHALSSFPQGIDCIIHTAGLSQHSLASETSTEVVDEAFQLNAVGAIKLTQALLPGLLKQGKGHFIVISSMAGAVPAPGQALYSAAKYALHGYFHTLRAELANTPIGVTICCPGPFKLADTNTPRYVIGPKGIIQEPRRHSKGLDAQDLVQLIAFAAEARLSECWLAKQPILAMAYIMQYCPVLGIYILNKVGPKRAAAAAKGDGYSMKAIFSKPKAT